MNFSRRGARDAHQGGCLAKYRDRSISHFPAQKTEFDPFQRVLDINAELGRGGIGFNSAKGHKSRCNSRGRQPGQTKMV